MENNTLYTRCPTCNTAFKVSQQMLAQAKGKVRCGACLAIFNATDYMLEPKTDTLASKRVHQENVNAQPVKESVSGSQIETGSKQNVIADDITEPDTPQATNSNTETETQHDIAPQPANSGDSDQRTEAIETPQASNADDKEEDFVEPELAFDDLDIDEFDEEPISVMPVEAQPKATPQPAREELDQLDESVTDPLEESFDGSSETSFNEELVEDDAIAALESEDLSEQLSSSSDENHLSLNEQDETLEETSATDLLNDPIEQDSDDIGDSLGADIESIENEETSVDALEQFEEDLSAIDESLDNFANEVDPVEQDFDTEFDASPLENSAQISTALNDQPQAETKPFDHEEDLIEESDFEDAIDESMEEVSEDLFDEQDLDLSEQFDQQMMDNDVEPDPLDEFEEIVQETQSGIKTKILLASVSLLLIVGFYSIWSNRQAIAWSDTWGSTMKAVCGFLPCDLKPKRDVSKIRLIQRQVGPDDEHENMLDIKVLFINDAAFDQPYPVIKIVFSNKDGNDVATKKFQPSEYLSSSQSNQSKSLEMMPKGLETHLHFKTKTPHPDALGFVFSFE